MNIDEHLPVSGVIYCYSTESLAVLSSGDLHALCTNTLQLQQQYNSVCPYEILLCHTDILIC